MGAQAEMTKKDAQFSRGTHQSHHETQIRLRHCHTQPSLWETKLDNLLENIRSVSKSNANKSDTKTLSSDGTGTSMQTQTQKDCREHSKHQSLLQTTSHSVRLKRRPPLTLKMNQAWRPPCQLQELDGMRQKSMRGSVEYIPPVEKDVRANTAKRVHDIPSSQAGNTLSSNHLLPIPDRSVHKVSGIRQQRRTSPITVSDISTLVRSNTSSSRLSENGSNSSTSGKLVLSQRLQTMDVRETIEYLREQGYTTTFIAEHLSVRGYTIELGGEAGMYRKYHKVWVQEYLDKVNE